jgi:hypothetical protein
MIIFLKEGSGRLVDYRLKDPYQILRIPHNATLEEIEIAYGRFSQSYSSQYSQDIYAEIISAYEILKDPKQRRAYDEGYDYALSSLPDTQYVGLISSSELDNKKALFHEVKFQDEQIRDFTIQEYFCRWKVPAAVIASICILLFLRSLVTTLTFSKVALIHLFVTTTVCMLFTWVGFWMIRFRFTPKTLAYAFSFICSTFYAFLLYKYTLVSEFRNVPRFIGKVGTEVKNLEIVGCIFTYFIVFYACGHFLEKEGMWRGISEGIDYLFECAMNSKKDSFL